MSLKSNFYNIFKALNPYNYSGLTQNRITEAISYYLFIIFFSVCILFVLFIPYVYHSGIYLDKGMAHFESINVSSNLELKDSFSLISDQAVRFDTGDANMTDEMVLVTPDAISYKRYLLIGPEREIPLVNGVELVGSSRARNLISAGLFFILPSLFFWAIVFATAYFTILLLLTYILALIVSTLFRIKAGPLQLMKLCLYASTIFVLLQLVLIPFFKVSLIPLAAYWVLLMVILFIWYDSPPERGKRVADDGDEKSFKGGSKDIFGKREGSSFGRSPKLDSGSSRDSYDVDENGNLKSAAKRRRSFDEENEGYVELK